MSKGCKDCDHWERITADTGHCRRMPPTPLVTPFTHSNGEIGGDENTSWPVTLRDDWCGEYRANYVWTLRKTWGLVEMAIGAFVLVWAVWMVLHGN